ncbi:hypothetical protein B566_EDAN009365 [Ephemera danica]|nr:hypothetical protein B566_EDAN009365 [Ephemera danica]
MALRNKAFGSAQEFVWAHDSSEYAIREGALQVKVFKNFKERKAFKPESGVEGIFGGFMLGVRSVAGLAMYDWETLNLVRRIEIQPRHAFWSESGELLCLATDDSYFILRYNADVVARALETKDAITEDGIEDAFEVLGEVNETVKTGIWVGDCFIYTNSVNRINYYVGGEIVTISHLDRTMYLLGYIPKDNRLYLGDKELNIVSYSLLLSVLEYQTAVMRKDFETANKVLPTVPKEQRTRVAHFLEKQGYKKEALFVSTDPEHKFELALQLGELNAALDLARDAGSQHKWRQLAELALARGQFKLAEECLANAQDFGGLLLLASSSCNAEMVQQLEVMAGAAEKNNITFMCNFLLGDTEKCLEILINTERLPEAAFFARTYLPSQVSRVVQLWKAALGKVSEKAAQALADPAEYENLFPGLQEAMRTEQFLKQEKDKKIPASAYKNLKPNIERSAVEEMHEAEAAGLFHYVAPTGDTKVNPSVSSKEEGGESASADEEGFDDATEDLLLDTASAVPPTHLRPQSFSNLEQGPPDSYQSNLDDLLGVADIAPGIANLDLNSPEVKKLTETDSFDEDDLLS